MNHTIFNIKPIAFVNNNRLIANDDPWGDLISEITIVDLLPDECLNGIEDFSHLEIIFYFHLSKISKHKADWPALRKISLET